METLERTTKPFTVDALALDAAAESARIAAVLRAQVSKDLRKRGIVLGLSGGIDSSVTAGLAARAVGPERVLGILMPESESDPESLRLGQAVARAFGIKTVLEDIAPILEGARCYDRRDAAIREVVPEFGPGWTCKVVIDPEFRSRGYNLSSLVVADPDGGEARHRLPLGVYQAIIAAANMKQRTRKQIEYYHADRLNYAVAGTPNRLEYDLGFFVKNGDGAADVKPIAHLLKSQVYALAAHLGVPEEIRARAPTTDTWSMAQSQEEFYFAADTRVMDICLLGLEMQAAPEEIAAAAGISPDQLDIIARDIAAKRRVAAVLSMPPLMVPPPDGTGRA